MSSPRPHRWPRVAEALGALIPKTALAPTVVAEADAAGRRKWIVAVSGGADSVALVLLLWAHWPRQRERLVLAHFNHRLRGAASAADVRFCRRLAAGLGIPCQTEAWKGGRAAHPSEAQAREVRQVFLEKVRRGHRARWIWTGHHADDVAEQVLMRVARGSGTAGLASPRPVQPSQQGRVWRLRPLLALRATVLREALTAAGGTWREDASNAQDQYFRNRVRHHVVPIWVQAAGRDAVGGATRSRQLLEEDDAALEAWLAELDPIDPAGRLQLGRLRGKPAAIWRRALHHWLARQQSPSALSRQGFEDLLAMVRAGQPRRFSLGKDGFARIRRGWLYFEQPFGN